LSIFINLTLVLSFYIISKNSVLNQLVSLDTTIIVFLLLLAALTFSNFIYYKLSYINEKENHIEENVISSPLVVTSEKQPETKEDEIVKDIDEAESKEQQEIKEKN